MKRSCFLLLTAAMAVAGFAQTPAPKLSFEVASIKPAGPLDPAKIRSGEAKIGQTITQERYELNQTPLLGMILLAYKPIQIFQVQGTQPWMMQDRFDLVAKMPAGATKDDVPALLKSLLADRFGFKYHMETKEHSAFILKVAKGGSNLTEAGAVEALDDDARNKEAAKGESVVNAGDQQVRMKTDAQGGMTATAKGGQNGTIKQSMTPDGLIHVEIQSMSIEELCGQLGALLTSPVVDQTGLKGRYSMTLEFTRDDLMGLMQAMGVSPQGGGAGAGAGAGANGGVAEASLPPGVGGSIFKSVERLGLVLEHSKAPVPMLVIDHVDKTPTEN